MLFVLLGTICADDQESLCYGHGSCTEKSVGEYECECAPGYEDEECETEINECQPNPCQNEATCNDLIADYTCDCTSQYHGDDCESKSYM